MGAAAEAKGLASEALERAGRRQARVLDNMAAEWKVQSCEITPSSFYNGHAIVPDRLVYTKAVPIPIPKESQFQFLGLFQPYCDE